MAESKIEAPPWRREPQSSMTCLDDLFPPQGVGCKKTLFASCARNDVRQQGLPFHNDQLQFRGAGSFQKQVSTLNSGLNFCPGCPLLRQGVVLVTWRVPSLVLC